MMRSRVPTARLRTPFFGSLALVPARADLAPPFASPTLALPHDYNHARLCAVDLMIVLRVLPGLVLVMQVSLGEKKATLRRCYGTARRPRYHFVAVND